LGAVGFSDPAISRQKAAAVVVDLSGFLVAVEGGFSGFLAVAEGGFSDFFAVAEGGFSDFFAVAADDPLGFSDVAVDAAEAVPVTATVGVLPAAGMSPGAWTTTTGDKGRWDGCCEAMSATIAGVGAGGDGRLGSSNSGVDERLRVVGTAGCRSGDERVEDSDWLSADMSSPSSRCRAERRLRVEAAGDASEMSTMGGSSSGGRTGGGG